MYERLSEAFFRGRGGSVLMRSDGQAKRHAGERVRLRSRPLSDWPGYVIERLAGDPHKILAADCHSGMVDRTDKRLRRTPGLTYF
jgi:hypothetical protein